MCRPTCRLTLSRTEYDREDISRGRLSRAAACAVLMAIAATESVWAQTTLVASFAEIPGLADSPEQGVLVEIVKAIDEVWEEGTIEMIVARVARSIQNVIRGEASFRM